MSGTHVTLKSGRQVGLAAFGDPVADRLVVVCHPTPGAADFDPDPIVTNRWGAHVLALDRPGYGGSPALPEGSPHSLRDRAGEVIELVASDESIADQISRSDYRHVGVVGWGTGAVVAAAIAVQRPQMVDRLALVSAPQPKAAAKVARRALAMPGNFDALHVAEDDPAFDRHAGLRNRLERMLDDAYLQGTAGVEADRMLIANTAWIEPLSTIKAGTLVLQGADDPVLDEDDLRWWSKHLPKPACRTVTGSASLTIVDAWQDVLAHVAPNHGSIEEKLRDHGEPAVSDVPEGH